MVSEEEWSHIKSLFNVDREICVTRNKTENVGECSELLTSEPKVCQQCVKARCEQEEQVSEIR